MNRLYFLVSTLTNGIRVMTLLHPSHDTNASNKPAQYLYHNNAFLLRFLNANEIQGVIESTPKPESQLAVPNTWTRRIDSFCHHLLYFPSFIIKRYNKSFLKEKKKLPWSTYQNLFTQRSPCVLTCQYYGSCLQNLTKLGFIIDYIVNK